MSTGLIIGIVIIVVIILWVVMTHNSFVSLGNSIDEAFSTMDVYLKKRYDLIPNIVETVKGYAKHESETLEAVIAARNKAYNAGTPSDKIAANAELSSGLGKLMAIAESYPDLKANQNFLELQSELSSMEGEIANSRKYYNGVVKKYNTMCETIPSNFVANIFHFEKQPLFQITDEKERENVKVQF